MKPPRRKNQYKGKPGRRTGPNTRRGKRIKTGPGILDRVKSAFNKNTSTPVVSSVNQNVNSTNTSTTTNPTSNASTNTTQKSGIDRRLDWLKQKEINEANEAQAKITAENNKLVDSSGNTKPTGNNQAMTDLFSGGNLEEIFGNYEASKIAGQSTGKFIENPTGSRFLQLSGGGGGTNQMSGLSSGNSGQIKSVNAHGKNSSKDFYGNNVTVMSTLVDKLANKRGINKGTAGYQEFITKAEQDLTRIGNARKIYDKEYDYSDHYGNVSSGGGIPEGFTFGDGGDNDLAQLDIARGGLGTPYQRINDETIMRQGRYVAGSGTGISGGSGVWESADIGSTDNIEDNPYQKFYFGNPELGGKEPKTIPGETWKQYNKEHKDEALRVTDTIDKNKRDQWYNNELMQEQKGNYPSLSYDFDLPDAAWTMANDDGSANTNMVLHKNK